MTFEEFRATGRDHVDLGAALPGQDLEGIPGRVYWDCLFIEYWADARFGKGPPDGKPTWLVMLDGWQQPCGPLIEMERALYDWAIVNGYDQ